MTKLITFGCSFTKYYWSTWADILGKEFDEFENRGTSGAGNTYIFNHVMQAIAGSEINKDTTVIVMWSSIIREDRFIDMRWLSPGNIYNQTKYNDAFMEYVDPIGFFVRDMAHVCATYHALRDTGCEFYFLSMMNFDSVLESLRLNFIQKLFSTDHVEVIKNKYKHYVNFTKPSVHETIFNLNWYTRSNDLIADKNLYQATKNHEHPEWPDVDEWENNTVSRLDKKIENELCSFALASSIDEIKKYKLWRRYDIHPTPALHLEYLEKVLPEFTISKDNKQQVQEENLNVLNNPHKYRKML